MLAQKCVYIRLQVQISISAISLEKLPKIISKQKLFLSRVCWKEKQYFSSDGCGIAVVVNLCKVCLSFFVFNM